MIRIVLIDDHILVRQGMRLLLENAKNIEIVGEASTGAEGVQLVRERQPTIAILDLKLPDISGIEVAARLLRLKPKPKILALSSAVHHEFPMRLLALGALGYVTKEASQQELINAINAVNQGQPFISPAVASRLALAKIDHKLTPVFSALTNKEIEVLILSVRHISAAEIAKRLHMSPKTVHSYRSHIFEKLGVSNDVELALLAIREGLVAIEEAGQ